jgi:teichuronic acid biosynthesis glycosyltransferase TuaC
MIASLPNPVMANSHPNPSLHVLTLTPFYPTQQDDAQGCFVAEPLAALDQHGITNTVLAVQPFYRTRSSAGESAHPAHWTRFPALPGGFGLPSSGAFLFARILKQVRRIHHANPVSVIHAHAALPCGHAAVLLGRELGVQFVVTVHGLDAFSTNQVGGYAGDWCKGISRLVYRSAKTVICVSEKVRDQVLEGAAAPVNTTVIYNGVDHQAFAPAREDNVVPGIILSVGNLIPTKGHELLLRAFANIHQQFPKSSCEIIGDGPELARLRTLASELKISEKIHFLGRRSRSQVAAAMRRCTLFALPSKYEGLGCVYLEAMSTERPVIACRGQGIEEIIHHRSNGWLVGPDDLPELTDALSSLLTDPQLQRQIGDTARQIILQSFTLEHQAEQLARLYQECAG